MGKVIRLTENDIERLVKKILVAEEEMTLNEGKKKRKWIQKVQKKIEKSGTEGSFKEYCGGEVTMACIKKAMESGDTDLIRKANYAKNIKGYKGAQH